MKIAFVLIILLAASNAAFSTPGCQEAANPGSGAGKTRPSAQQKCASAQRVTLADLLSIQDSIIELDISPTGRWIAQSKGEQLSVREVQNGRVIRNIGQGIMPKWSPGERKLAFYSMRSGSLQLWVWDVQHDSLIQVTNITGGVDPEPNTRVASYLISDAFLFDWSADETRIVFASRVALDRVQREPPESNEWQVASRRPGAPKVLTNVTPSDLALRDIFIHRGLQLGLLQSKDGRSLSSLETRETEELFNQLFIVELSTRQTVQITHGRQTSFHPTWSPVGDSIAYVTVPDPMVRLGVVIPRSELNIIDAATGKIRTLRAGIGIKSRPKWAPDGSKIAFLSSRAAYDWQRIYQVDVSDPKSSTTSIQFDRFIYSDYDWSHDGSGFIVRYRDGQSTRLGRIDGKSETAIDVVPHETYPISVGQFTQSNRGLVAWRQKDPVKLISVKYVRGIGEAVNILEIDQLSAENLDLGRTEQVHWINSRGDELDGAVLLPPEYTKSKRYPLIVDAYPLQPGVDWLSPMGGNYSWASAGYVVFRPAPRAPHAWIVGWKSKAFSEAGKGAHGWQVMVDDVMSGVDSLISRGMVDSDRMCLYGFSNGGGVVNYLVTKTDRFRCAVSVSPASSNWIRPALWKSDDSIESPTGGLKFAGNLTLENNVDELIEMSSVFHLHSVETPMLIAVGDDDATDFLLDSVELYQGLRRREPIRDVTFLRYPNQGHGFDGDSLRDFWEREMKFFERYLLNCGARQSQASSTRQNQAGRVTRLRGTPRTRRSEKVAESRCRRRP